MNAITTKISLFNSANDSSIPSEEITEQEFIDLIKAEHFKKEIELLRQEEDKDKKNVLKKQLPAITLSGTFTERKSDKIKTHSGRLQIDLDGIKEKGLDPESVKQKLMELPWIRASFISPSGNGVKGIAVIPPSIEDHKEIFNQIDEVLKSRFGLKNDPAVKDTTRLFFLSSDSNLLERKDPIEFPFIKKQELNEKTLPPLTKFSDQNLDELMVSKALEVIPSKQKDDERYEEIRDLIWSLCSGLGESKASYFAHQLIGSSSSMNPEEIISQFKPGHLSLGTFFEIAKKYGFDQKAHFTQNKKEVKAELQNSKLRGTSEEIDSILDQEKILREKLQEIKAKKKEILIQTPEGNVSKLEFLSFQNDFQNKLKLIEQGKASITDLSLMSKDFKTKIKVSQEITFGNSFAELLTEEANRDIGIPLPLHWKLYDEREDGRKSGQIFMKRGLPSLIGAFSGAGKTTFLLNLILDAIKQKRKSIFFSLEMTESQLAMNLYRIWMKESKGRTYDIETFSKQGKTPEEQLTFMEFQNFVQGHLTLVYCRGKSSSEIIELHDRFIQKNEVDQVFLDYLQIISPEKSSRVKDRRLQVIETMELLTDRIAETKSAWIISAQTNREGHKEGNQDHSNFQESASIEQNSGLAIVLKRRLEEGSDKDILEVNVSKNRFGACRKKDLFIDRRSQFIESPAPPKEKEERKEKKK